MRDAEAAHMSASADLEDARASLLVEKDRLTCARAALLRAAAHSDQGCS